MKSTTKTEPETHVQYYRRLAFSTRLCSGTVADRADILIDTARDHHQRHELGKHVTCTACCAAVRTTVQAMKPQLPPVVRLSLMVLLDHIEPGWQNCTAVVRAWLNGELEDAPAPAPTEEV